jgi:hypothetical protein
MLRAVQGIDIGRNPHLNSLFANFAVDTSKRRPASPAWNLALVLQAMTQPPRFFDISISGQHVFMFDGIERSDTKMSITLNMKT